ncbi:MAG: MFS transporter [Candidatus Schekmanbacteria bacterium]|nr:MFS transporter [Candidatus Schekmanbacteria bacterium]
MSSSLKARNAHHEDPLPQLPPLAGRGTEGGIAAPGGEATSLRLMCLLYVLSISGIFWLAYLPHYMGMMGMAPALVGLVFGLRSVVSSLSCPAWAHATDRAGAALPVLRTQYALGVIAFAGFALTTSRPALVLSLLAAAATAGGALPIVDTLALRRVGPRGFGAVRAWGSAGYALTSFAAGGVGWFLGSHDRVAVVAPWAQAVAALATLCLLLRMPARSPRTAGGGSASDTGRSVGGLWRSARELPGLRLAALLAPAALHWAALAPFHTFLVTLAEVREMPGWVPGAAVGVAVSCEVVVLARGDGLLARFSPPTLLLFSFAISALRWLATSAVTHPVLLVALQLAHGASFAAFYVALVALMTEAVPDRLRATGQSLLYLFVFGMGTAIGAALSGWIIELTSVPTLFVCASAGELLAIAVAIPLVLAHRDRSGC